MIFTALAIILVLVQYIFVVLSVGSARAKADIKAPATTGDPVFERTFRVQQNTVEQLMLFLPSLVLFGWFVADLWALLPATLFLLGRALYFRSYIADPAKRGPGMLITILGSVIALAGAMVAVIIDLARMIA